MQFLKHLLTPVQHWLFFVLLLLNVWVDLIEFSG